MLGRYDATNVVSAQVAVVTNIGLDHTSGEGEWRRSIASEKAGIIEPASTLVLGELDESLHPIFLDEGPAHAVVRGEAFDLTDDRLAVGGRLLGVRTPRGLYDEVFLSLHGAHQAENASLALTAVEEFFDSPLPDDVVEEAFGTIIVPGRLEVVHRSPTIVIDTAHNVPGLRRLPSRLPTTSARAAVATSSSGCKTGECLSTRTRCRWRTTSWLRHARRPPLAA